jgi:protein tyrosine phosphatase (PTP) superfamily phosphohydrolase (DUF442 family)
MTIKLSKVKSNTRHKWLLAASLAVVVATCIWVWDSFLEVRIIPKRFGVVEQGRIYRSGQLSATLVKKVLAKHNIRVIVDLGAHKPKNPDQQAEKQAASELDIDILRFPLRGNGTGDVNEYARAITAIDSAEKNNKPVLVHCHAGTQRTGGVIAAYRLLKQKKDPTSVINELKQYDWDPKDNAVLLTYLDNNMPELAMLLKQKGVIGEIPSTLPKLSQN